MLARAALRCSSSGITGSTRTSLAHQVDDLLAEQVLRLLLVQPELVDDLRQARPGEDLRGHQVQALVDVALRDARLDQLLGDRLRLHQHGGVARVDVRAAPSRSSRPRASTPSAVAPTTFARRRRIPPRSLIWRPPSMFMRRIRVRDGGAGHHNGMGSKTCRTPNVARKFSKSEALPRVSLSGILLVVAHLSIEGCGLEQLVGDAGGHPPAVGIDVRRPRVELNATPFRAATLGSPGGRPGWLPPPHRRSARCRRRTPAARSRRARELPALGEIPGIRERDRVDDHRAAEARGVALLARVAQRGGQGRRPALREHGLDEARDLVSSLSPLRVRVRDRDLIGRRSTGSTRRIGPSDVAGAVRRDRMPSTVPQFEPERAAGCPERGSRTGSAARRRSPPEAAHRQHRNGIVRADRSASSCSVSR